MKKIIILISVLLFSVCICAQNQGDIRLNEVMLHNTTNALDKYGQHSQWLEIFNSSFGTVKMGGCFISNDRNNLKKHQITKNDARTYVKPRQFRIIWFNAEAIGTFYANFKIAAGDTLYFTSSDGVNIVDRITVPELTENQSFGRIIDGEGSIDGSNVPWEVFPTATANASNVERITETKSMKMAKVDPKGFLMAITCMSVVFIALILLVFIFKFTGKVSVKHLQETSDKVSKKKGEANINVAETSNEVYAAIAMGLHLYRQESEAHDEESLTITMSHTNKQYSPWSQKIRGIRQTPQRKNKKKRI
ncbi:MAG: OadG family transporter subunit [Bacteroidales bacterium]